MDRSRAEAIRHVLNTLEAYEGFREALQEYQAGTPDTTTLTITNTLEGNSVSETIKLNKGVNVDTMKEELDTKITELEQLLITL